MGKKIPTAIAPPFPPMARWDEIKGRRQEAVAMEQALKMESIQRSCLNCAGGHGEYVDLIERGLAPFPSWIYGVSVATGLAVAWGITVTNGPPPPARGGGHNGQRSQLVPWVCYQLQKARCPNSAACGTGRRLAMCKCRAEHPIGVACCSFTAAKHCVLPMRSDQLDIHSNDAEASTRILGDARPLQKSKGSVNALRVMKPQVVGGDWEGGWSVCGANPQSHPCELFGTRRNGV
jgi:hypothetical protein